MTGTQKSDEIQFTILHTNDEHSSLLPHSPAVDHNPEDPMDPNDPTVGGFARLATAIDELRDKKETTGEATLLLSAGDFLGEAPFGWLAPDGHGAELRLLRRMGYDAATVGNHEYDYGLDVLSGYLSAAGYPDAHADLPLLTANTTPPDEHPLADHYQHETATFDVGGATVGVFGFIGETAASVVSDAGDTEFADPVETASSTVEKLVAAGADIVVTLSHSGIEEDRKLAQDVDGIDVIVASHCHTALHEPVYENGTPIVQASAYGEYLGVLELGYSHETGELRVRNDETETDYLKPIDSRYPPKQEIAEQVAKYKQQLDDLVAEMTDGAYDDVMETIARSEFCLDVDPPKQETPAGNFVTDALRLGVAAETGKDVDVALQANGAIRGDIQPGTKESTEGDVSFYEMARTTGLGYGNDGYAGYPVVSAYLTGDELRQLLEVAVLLEETMDNTYYLQFSGLRYEYNPKDAVLFTVPFFDIPVPTGRAVKSADLYTGEGVQPELESTKPSDYVTLERDDEELYHVVTDTYILGFLPMIGEMVPQMEIQPKTEDGEPIPPDKFDEFIIRNEGKELKYWRITVEYTATQSRHEQECTKKDDDIPRISNYYADARDRIVPVETFPLPRAVLLTVVLFAFLVVAFLAGLRTLKGTE